MTRRLRRGALLLAGLLAASAAVWVATGWLDGPLGMVPGGAFRASGEPCQAAPWAEFADAREVEVEVSPRSPRSVTTWSVVLGEQLFLPADFLTPWKRWPYQVLADSHVRIRVAGRIFDCRATRVEDEALIGRLREAAAAKYGLTADGLAARVEVWWFRVEAR